MEICKVMFTKFPHPPLGEGWGEGIHSIGYSLTLTLSQREREFIRCSTNV